MSKKWKVGIVSGIVAVFCLVSLPWFGLTTNARTVPMAARFAPSAADKKLPKEETTGMYSVDKAHSYVGFRVRHMGLVEVPGSFNEFSGTIDLDSKKVKNSTVEFSVDVKSVDTRINGRDNHLRSKDFFAVEDFPTMTFKSTRVKKKGKGYRVYGDLTMKGVTKQVMIPFRIYGPIKDARGNIKMGIEGETTINRRSYNVDYGSNLPSGVAVISDNVTIEIQLETAMRKKKEADETR